MTRTARVAKGLLQRAKVVDWVEEQRRRKWRWAGHVARSDDGRWAVRMLDWAPMARARRVGRPVLRWEDNIANFAKELGINWRVHAQNRGDWEELESKFVQHGGT